MSEFKVGDTVYAVKGRDAGTEATDHRFGYNGYMDVFADGAPGTVSAIEGDCITVVTNGQTRGWSYHASELRSTPALTFATAQPRAEAVVKEKRKKVVDGARKTLYAIIQQGQLVGVHLTREDARQAKASIGGLSGGVTIVTYEPRKEIR